MTTKMLEVVVCDFHHKSDRPAVTKVSIDVCSTHAAMFDAVTEGEFQCDDCGRLFTTRQGLGRHRGSKHGTKSARKAKAAAA